MWIAAVCSLFAALLTRVLWRRWKYDLHKIPAPPGLPLLGHTLDFACGEGLTQPSRWFGKAFKQLNYPKLLRFEVMGSTQLAVADEKLIKEVVNSPKDTFPLMGGDNFLLPMLGNDMHTQCLLLTAKPCAYSKAVRKVYANAFNSANLKAAMPRIQAVMDKMISVIESKREESPIEMQELFVKTTLDTIGAVALDMNLGGLDDSTNLIKCILAAGYVARENFQNPLKPIYCKLFPKSKGAQAQRTVVERLNKEWKRLTDEILNREDPASGEEFIWYRLKRLIDPETKKPLPYKSLMSEIATVAIGGTDTSGLQLGWIFAILASRPDVVQKILEELKQHGLFGESSRELKFEDLAHLTYVTAVVKEGMRVAHIVPMAMPRAIPRDMSILGYKVPKGTKIIWIGNRAFFLGTDWNNPETFKPERWLAGDEICQKRNMMFSVGPRDCIGQKLAMFEMRLAIIIILQKYQISMVEPFEALANNTRVGFVIEAKEGIWLNLTPRMEP